MPGIRGTRTYPTNFSKTSTNPLSRFASQSSPPRLTSSDMSNDSLPLFFTLNDGRKLPSVGLGCWMGSPGGGVDAENMTQLALKLGYRHLDTAAGYGNEEHVGKAVRESGIPRGEIFVTTKLNNPDHGNVKEAFEKSLKNLDCEYIDLYLMHWPQAVDASGNVLPADQEPTFVQTWIEMEKLLEIGKVKSIGVSNFSIKNLEILLPQVKIVPAVNQIQLHPCLPQFELLEYCKNKGIVVTAYTPLGRADSPLFKDKTCLALAEKNNVSVSNLLLSWGVQRGTSVIPKSAREERLKDNIAVKRLSDEDFAVIDAVHKKPGMHRQLIGPPGFNKETGTFAGWTWDQLGFNLDKQGYWIS